MQRLRPLKILFIALIFLALWNLSGKKYVARTQHKPVPPGADWL